MGTPEKLSSLFADCVTICSERSQLYGDAWKKNGSFGNIERAIQKANRAIAALQRDEPMSALDDLLDLINYTGFAIICMELGLISGERPRCKCICHYADGVSHNDYTLTPCCEEWR